MKRILPLPFLLAAALAASACGSESKTLDTTNVEKDLQEVGSATGVETSAECPSEVEDVKKGKTYDCTITYAGNKTNKQTVQMRIGDNDESEFVNQQAVSDESALRGIVAQTEKDPAAICEHVTEEILEQLGGEDCPTNAQEQADDKPANIKSVSIEGDTATMVSSESTTTFERDEQGAWVLTAVE